MEEIYEPLKRAFADTYAFYVKAQNYHWNVEGPMFSMYHEFFGNLYEEVGGSIDRFAEEIRAQGAYAPGAFSRFIELATIKDDDTINTPGVMISNLYSDNMIVYASIKAARDVADQYGENGLVNFLEERMDQHKKHAWMLRSYLK